MFKKSKICTGVLAALSGGMLVVAGSALAQGVQRVEITGSSIKRLDAETAAPVQVLSREAIERSGVTSVEQLLRLVSANSSSGSTAGASSSGATTGGISTVSLRALGPDRTLVLVNGKRIAAYGAPNTSAAVDVDSIPVSAIERVEVLKDGASAIYGSDAIGGVVNFILRRKMTGTELAASYGAATQDGKGSVARLTAVTGISGDNFSIMALASYQKDQALFGKDRDFANASIRVDKNQNGSSSRTDPGNINIPGVSGTRNPNVIGGVGNCGPRSVFVPAFSTTNCFFDPAPFVGLLPETERLGVLVSGRWSLSPAAELYGDIGFTSKKAQTVIQPAPIDSAFGIPFTLTTASPFYPTSFVTGLTGGATPNLRVRYRPFITGNRDLTDQGDNARIVLGVEGALAGWDYDANFIHSASKVTETLNGGYYRIAGGAASGGPGIVNLLSGNVRNGSGATLWVNPFGTNSAEVIAAAQATNFVGTAFATKTELTGLQGKASSSVLKFANGGLDLAVGAELRRERFNLQSSAALATGDISGYGGNFVPIDKSRPVVGLFSELQLTPMKGLELSGAARFDRYGAVSNSNVVADATGLLNGLTSVNGDTIGAAAVSQVAGQTATNAPTFSKATAKLGLVYKVIPEVVLRGTASTGFRAPTLLDLFGPLQAGVTAVINDSARCPTTNSADDCATQFNNYSGGRGDLKPERSTNMTLGFVTEPLSGLSFGLDYFRIDIKDQITTLAPDFLLRNEAQYRSRISRGAVETAFPTLPGPIIAIDQRQENIGKVKIQGVDWDFRYRTSTSIGRLEFGLNGTYTSKWDSVNPDGSTKSSLGTTSSTVAGAIPRVKTSFTGGWSNGPVVTSVSINWQSKLTDICGNQAQDDFGDCAPGFTPPKVPSYTTVDLFAQYNGIKGLALSLGLKNAFDQKPPYVNGAGGAFQSGYDPTWVDPRGRYVYVTAKYKF